MINPYLELALPINVVLTFKVNTLPAEISRFEWAVVYERQARQDVSRAVQAAYYNGTLGN